MSITPKAIQDLLDELEASKQSRLRAWNVLQRLRSVLSELGNIAIPPPAQKTFDAEGETLEHALKTKQKSLDALKWGLIPNWSKDPKIAYKTINARAESVDTAPSFRQAFMKRRCLIPCDGFYEWKKVSGGKIPYSISMKDDSPFLFAGLWEGWKIRLAANGCAPAQSSPANRTSSSGRSTPGCR
jgi:putative SOS response-associated peptidase YedK